METKYTKEKWILDKNPYIGEYDEEYSIQYCHPVDGLKVICVVYGCINNALLILKAPEMIEMLIEVSKHHQGGHSEIGNKIRQLIKGATEL